MKKRLISLVIAVLVVMSVFAAAQANETSSCSGFLGTIKCFFFGDAAKREALGGKAWWDTNVVGKAAESVNGWLAESDNSYKCVSESGCYTADGAYVDEGIGFSDDTFNPLNVKSPPSVGKSSPDISGEWRCGNKFCTCYADECSGFDLVAKEGQTVSISNAGFYTYKENFVCSGETCTCVAELCPRGDGSAAVKGDEVKAPTQEEKAVTEEGKKVKSGAEKKKPEGGTREIIIVNGVEYIYNKQNNKVYDSNNNEITTVQVKTDNNGKPILNEEGIPTSIVPKKGYEFVTGGKGLETKEVKTKEGTTLSVTLEAKALIGEKLFKQYAELEWSVNEGVYTGTPKNEKDKTKITIKPQNNGLALISEEGVKNTVVFKQNIIATQSKDQMTNKMATMSDGTPVYLEEGDLGKISGPLYASKEAKEEGKSLGTFETDPTKSTFINYETKMEYITDSSGKYILEGDYYGKDNFKPTGGTYATTTTKDGKTVSTEYYVNYDYDGFGEDKK
ncbi:hypothetical protein HZC32_00510 [Candidatus Woesearchaeota archaeon]|nr:hypothetical protein [Candidatus Woesearchaeota archaeon]